jgi:cob(I)alamin adenosyltransferase
MKIYTKGGDKGRTTLANGSRTSKADPRLETYGTADELNSFVGLLRSKTGDGTQPQLEWIQNRLFNLGAMLAAAEGEWISLDDVRQLEEWIDEMQAGQPPLKAFILPGGNEPVALCHVCRTVTRRLERQMVVAREQGTPIDSEAMQFVNRLSDFWFVLALKQAENDKISLFFWKK